MAFFFQILSCCAVNYRASSRTKTWTIARWFYVFELIRNFERRFKDFFEFEGNGKFAAVAAVLKPQFKVRWVRCLSIAAQERVKQATMEAAKEASTRWPRSNDEKLSRVEHDNYDFGKDVEIAASENFSLEESKTELEMRTFMSEPCCQEMSVINKFPEIKDLFLQYNTALPSSAPVERLFSYATMMNLPRYNRLTDAHFEKRTISKCNSAISWTLSKDNKSTHKAFYRRNNCLI